MVSSTAWQRVTGGYGLRVTAGCHHLVALRFDASHLATNQHLRRRSDASHASSAKNISEIANYFPCEILNDLHGIFTYKQYFENKT